MFRLTADLQGLAIVVTDGVAGEVKVFYFDAEA